MVFKEFQRLKIGNSQNHCPIEILGRFLVILIRFYKVFLIISMGHWRDTSLQKMAKSDSIWQRVVLIKLLFILF